MILQKQNLCNQGYYIKTLSRLQFGHFLMTVSHQNESEVRPHNNPSFPKQMGFFFGLRTGVTDPMTTESPIHHQLIATCPSLAGYLYWCVAFLLPVSKLAIDEQPSCTDFTTLYFWSVVVEIVLHVVCVQCATAYSYLGCTTTPWGIEGAVNSSPCIKVVSDSKVISYLGFCLVVFSCVFWCVSENWEIPKNFERSG